MKHLLLIFVFASSSLNAAVYDICNSDYHDDSTKEDVYFVNTHTKVERLQSLDNFSKSNCENKGWEFSSQLIETEKIRTFCINPKNIRESEILYFYFNYDGKMLYSRSLSNCSKQISYFAQANALRAYLLPSK